VNSPFQLSLSTIAEIVDARLVGNPDQLICGLAALQDAGPNQLSFLSSSQYRKYLGSTGAGAVLLTESDAGDFPGNALIVANPYVAYARLSHRFDPKPLAVPGIHPSAVVEADAQVDPTASIGPGAVISSGAQVGAGTVIGAQCFVGARSVVGSDGWLAPRVSIYHDVHIGDRVVIQSGAVLGSEGFGFANDRGHWEKIAQIGGVVVGDDVEIGANTTIDRGALAETRIGNGVKLDNQIHIAHNVHVGDHTAIAACVGISGSTRIGRHCTIAGGVGMVGHIEICDNVFVTGMTMVTRSITEPGAYSSGTAMQPAVEWRKSVARFRHLDSLAKKVQRLEKELMAVTRDSQGSSES
tara:strand:- start:3484 stop:4545 length:1062 start_codon:yes stop_codon:yes gene_type:complete